MDVAKVLTKLILLFAQRLETLASFKYSYLKENEIEKGDNCWAVF